MKRLIMIILVIALSFLFLAVSIEQNSYNKTYYIKSYYKYDIENQTGKSMSELEEITDHIILYLKNKGNNELLKPYFNEREVLHMEDVQKLFNLTRYIKYIGIILSLSIIICFIFKKEYLALGKTLCFGLFINHILLIILGILVRVDFNKYFNYFHLIFFTNDLWILDPSTDLMIQMLPEDFFFGMAKNIMLSFLIYLAIIQIIGCFYIRRGRKIYERGNRKS
ncbi:TIGR01906 family membrane protein [Wansuia hejianensis]|uniref:TIGR01906 family membrane protein n=1 Tax=Wansuia hejianensis TaxID=2763667 RepID=A0A926IM14_9FIRM|nr:TIGR01906 family membrane protein [Wansuia hejianensis]MBC8590729.1 TIGR01906 family membrane protein [Wansuia hejianensis]